jgi:hypothetical protein
MKKTIYLTLLFAMISCDKHEKANRMLENPSMEDAIYTSIIHNEQRLSKLLDRMSKSDNCKKTLCKRKDFIASLCHSENMDTLLNKDNEMMDQMTGKLIFKMQTDSMFCDHTCRRLMDVEKIKNQLKKEAIKK